jgi:serine/threonine-protein kinase RsbW
MLKLRMEEPFHYALALGSTPAHLEAMNAWLHGIFARHDLGPGVAFKLELCLNEAVENVIRYAFDGGAHRIDVALNIYGDRAEAQVSDDGKPFNPLTVALAPPPLRVSLFEPDPWAIS